MNCCCCCCYGFHGLRGCCWFWLSHSCSVSARNNTCSPQSHHFLRNQRCQSSGQGNSTSRSNHTQSPSCNLHKSYTTCPCNSIRTRESDRLLPFLWCQAAALDN